MSALVWRLARLLPLWLVVHAAVAAEPLVVADLPYKAGADLTDYERQRCRLDVWKPADAHDAPVVIWFYGGGMTSGDKGSKWSADKGRSLARAGFVVVLPNYRLSPKVTYPAYIQDAASAVAWAYQHSAEYGGNPRRLFIAGHSAGAYLALMVGMAPDYLTAVGVPTEAVAGIVSVSGQAMTHNAVRNERGLLPMTIIADDAAPIRWIHAGLPPMLMLYGDQDAPGRAEEVSFFAAMLRAAGHTSVTTQCIADRTHGGIADGLAVDGDPARTAMIDFVRR